MEFECVRAFGLHMCWNSLFLRRSYFCHVMSPRTVAATTVAVYNFRSSWLFHLDAGTPVQLRPYILWPLHILLLLMSILYIILWEWTEGITNTSTAQRTSIMSVSHISETHIDIVGSWYVMSSRQFFRVHFPGLFAVNVVSKFFPALNVKI